MRSSDLTTTRSRFLLVWQGALAALVVLGLDTASAPAQNSTDHYQLRADLPPGTVGQNRLARGGPVMGYYQPVRLESIDGISIAPAIEGLFAQPQPAPLLVGLLIGEVYRFRVTRIPLHPGAEVYPTIEVIDRLYPPEGLAHRFPIPIELTKEELELALEGKLVTRVIYVENPQNALPRSEGPHQRYFETRAVVDPLEVADQLGRPIAILRIGSRQPEATGPDNNFLFGSPPLLPLIEEAQEEHFEAVPSGSGQPSR